MSSTIPEADPDEPVETKPFKFVTGEFVPGHCVMLNYALEQSENRPQLLTRTSWYVFGYSFSLFYHIDDI